MFDETLNIFFHPDKKLHDRILKVKNTEELTDQMEMEITRYLQHCAQESLSDTNYKNLSLLIRIIHEMENIGDSVFNISLSEQYMCDKKITLHSKATEDISKLSELTKSFLTLIRSKMVIFINEEELKKAYELEVNINEFRRSVHKAARARMQQGEDVRGELLFLDLVKYMEHIGDSCLNIMQALNQIAV
jgi:phosphate:Na+ symporter